MTKIHIQLFIATILVHNMKVSGAPELINKLQDVIKTEPENIQTNAKTEHITLESGAEVEPDELKHKGESSTVTDIKNSEDKTAQGQRQKRWYNHFAYGFSPVSPIVDPGYVKRDDSANTGVFGLEDSFSQIYRRLQDIANIARQPNPSPPIPIQFPALFPVIYVPQVGCGCTPQNNAPTSPPQNNDNDSTPGVSNRFPDMDDTRQNWGFVVNETETTEGEDDFIRPISFDPIRPPRPISRPPPPVEHGSSQSDSSNSEGQTEASTTVAATTQNVSSSNPGSDKAPSACDAAVLSCCHQLQVTYDCFASQGCPDPTSYGNPCDANVIFQVVDKFQKFYGQRLG